MPLQDCYISFKGLVLHYQIAKPKGAVLHRALLIPAPGQSCYNWRLILPQLQQMGCLCVLVDLPGFGQSMCGSGVPHRQDTRAKLLWGILDQVDRDMSGRINRWNIIGQGSSAGTALTMAYQQPDSCGSLTLLSPILRCYIPRFLKPLVRSNLGNALLKRWYKNNILNRSKFRKHMRWLYGRPQHAAVAETIQAPFRRPGSDESLQRLLLNGSIIPHGALNDWFPTMVLWGEHDKLLGCRPPAYMRKLLSHAEFHILRYGGHYCAETNHLEVCDYLRGWVRDVWA